MPWAVYLKIWGVGVGDKADCLKKGPRPIGGMPSVGVGGLSNLKIWDFWVMTIREMTNIM